MDLSLILNILMEALKNEIFLAVLFVIFVVILYKIFKLVTEIAIVGIISALFPLFLAKGMNLPIALSLSTFLFFIVLGIGLLLLYKAFSVVKAPFKLLGSKLGLVAILLIAIGAIWFFYFYKPAGTDFTGLVDRNCTTSFDCEFSRLDCCDFCNTGTPVNKRSAQLIADSRSRSCNVNSCPSSNCNDMSNITGGILNSTPSLSCVSSRCTAEINCTLLCSYANSSQSYISEAAAVLYLNASDLRSQCSC